MNLSKNKMIHLIHETKETWLSRPERDTFIKMNNQVYKKIDQAFAKLDEEVKHEHCEYNHVIKNIAILIRIIKHEYEDTKQNYFNIIMSSQQRKRRFV